MPGFPRPSCRTLPVETGTENGYRPAQCPTPNELFLRSAVAGASSKACGTDRDLGLPCHRGSIDAKQRSRSLLESRLATSGHLAGRKGHLRTFGGLPDKISPQWGYSHRVTAPGSQLKIPYCQWQSASAFVIASVLISSQTPELRCVSGHDLKLE